MTAGAAKATARLAAVFFDLGDTLMIEESEVKDGDETTIRADLLPGAGDMVRRLHARGLRLALVADSRPNTPPNVLRQHGLLDLFAHLTISDVIGALKPDARMFSDALAALDIAPTRYGDVVMVGNNLERDIVGANRLGLISVFLHWNERRRTRPLTDEEQPQYTVHSIEELERLIERLDGTQPTPAQRAGEGLS